MRETLRRLFVVIVWAFTGLIIAGTLFASDLPEFDKAWVSLAAYGSGWVVHKVVNWIFQHKEIS